MNKINEYISSQFKNPRGIAGKIIRKSERYSR